MVCLIIVVDVYEEGTLLVYKEGALLMKSRKFSLLLKLLHLSANQSKMMRVQVPFGRYPGTPMKVRTPNGEILKVIVPQGAGPGAVFATRYNEGVRAIPVDTNGDGIADRVHVDTTGTLTAST